MASDHSTLLRKLRRQGFTVEQTKRSGHYRVRKGDSRFVTIPGTPSDSWRGLKNCVRDLRKIGYQP